MYRKRRSHESAITDLLLPRRGESLLCGPRVHKMRPAIDRHQIWTADRGLYYTRPQGIFSPCIIKFEAPSMNDKKTYGKHILAAMFIATVTILSGCNTVAGVGKDVQAAGESTTEAADKVSDKM